MSTSYSPSTLFPFYAGMPAKSGTWDKTVLGGKGAALAEMSAMGLPVPPGIIIPVSECIAYRNLAHLPAIRATLVNDLATRVIEFFTSEVVPTLGYFPLLSVRSGARVSMPGMMDTILNLGMHVFALKEWQKRLGETCANECYSLLKKSFAEHNKPVPSTVHGQLVQAIATVFESWDSERAVEYRKMHGYPDDWGTAVTVQAMVFGNMNNASCSGVLFTRDPATGEDFVTGEFLPQAQGEDVVAGLRTPRELHLMEQWNPKVLDELLSISARLEAHYHDMQDIEFTVQDGKLWILQTRNGKRTARAAFVIAHDLALEGVIGKKEAVKRVTAEQYQTLLREEIAPDFKATPTLTGLAASPGVASGVAVFDPSQVANTKNAILIRKDTSPEDFPAMVAAVGVLTSTGGMTSHAAVVARGINRPAVVGASNLELHGVSGALVVRDGKTVSAIHPGDKLTIDGATGRVWVGIEVDRVGGVIPDEATQILHWARDAYEGAVAYEVQPSLTLPQSGRHYLSVRALIGKTAISALLKKLKAEPALSGVLGFAGTTQVTEHPSDARYVSFLVGDGSDRVPSGCLDGFTKALVQKSVPAKIKGRWVVHLPDDAPQHVRLQLEDAGWSVVQPVSALSELLNAKGWVVVNDEFRARLKEEGVLVADILALLDRSGRKVREFGKVVSEVGFLQEALGK